MTRRSVGTITMVSLLYSISHSRNCSMTLEHNEYSWHESQYASKTGQERDLHPVLGQSSGTLQMHREFRGCWPSPVTSSHLFCYIISTYKAACVISLNQWVLKSPTIPFWKAGYVKAAQWHLPLLLSCAILIAKCFRKSLFAEENS